MLIIIISQVVNNKIIVIGITIVILYTNSAKTVNLIMANKQNKMISWILIEIEEPDKEGQGV